MKEHADDTKTTNDQTSVSEFGSNCKNELRDVKQEVTIQHQVVKHLL